METTLRKYFILLILALFCAKLTAGPFSPLTYSPPVKFIDVDADKCSVQLFVSPSGNDSWSGRKADISLNDGPFATIGRARKEILALKRNGAMPKGGIAVNFRAGVYSFSESMEMDAQDSGSNDSPVIYRAWKDEFVRLLGGRKLSAKDFSPVKDPIKLTRIDSAAKGKVVQINAKALGLEHSDQFPDVFSDGGGIFELFFNGNRMPLSRWPDEGTTTMQEVLVNGDKTTSGVFIYRGNRPERWDQSTGVWLKGQWRVGWEDPAIKVAAIDKQSRQITFAGKIGLGIGNKYTRPKGNGKEPWIAMNLLEEITRPGEWCIDFATGIVYFWPPDDLGNADILVTQLDKPIISADGLSNTAFIGLVFEGSLGDGMVLTKSKHNLIAGCTFRSLGGRGVVLDGETSGIQSCDMYGLGKGCIVISGGDREKLIESGNYIVNNHLHDYAVLKAQYSAAIDLYSDNKNAPAVGMLVAHNLIHHAPRDAVLFAGNKIVFEYNEIHSCGFATADVGAFYSWLDWTIRGVVIRYNFMHNTVGGVNPDDGASGTFVYANIFAGNRTGVWIASGPDHTVMNNIFVKSEGSVFGMDDRGVSRGYATNKNLLKQVNSINPTAAPWSVEFPEMATLLESHPELPLRTKFTGNLVWIKKGDAVSIKMKKENKTDTTLIKIERNFITDTDPGFVDAGSGNFNLKPTSPVFQKIPGFPKIDVNKMGLYIDKYRKALPSPADAGRLKEQNPWKEDDTEMYFGT